MNDTDFIALSADESATVDGGYSWIVILAGAALIMTKDIVDHYKDLEAGFKEGYRDGLK